MQVFLVSDDPDLVFVLQYALPQAGFEVVSAGRAEAGTLLHQTSPAALIVDDGGAADSGLPTLRCLTAELPVPYILLTPRDDVNASELSPDCVAVLWKPFPLADLVWHLRAISQRPGGGGAEPAAGHNLTSKGGGR